MQTGIRGRTPVSPMNATGRRFAELQAEQDAKKRAEAAGPVDIDAVKRTEYMRGWDEGYNAGVQAVIRQLTDAGVIDADEPVTESQDVD